MSPVLVVSDLLVSPMDDEENDLFMKVQFPHNVNLSHRLPVSNRVQE